MYTIGFSMNINYNIPEVFDLCFMSPTFKGCRLYWSRKRNVLCCSAKRGKNNILDFDDDGVTIIWRYDKYKLMFIILHD